MIWRRKTRAVGIPAPAPTPVDTAAAIEQFAAQARWLFEWHNKRSDGFSSRSVAVLGFTGVILALLPGALALPDGVEVTQGIRWCLIATAPLLLITGTLCLFAFAPQQSGLSSISQLRSQWRDFASGKRRAETGANIAESLLHGESVTASSPVEIAMWEANRRGGWFKCSIYSLVAAFGTLTVLVTQLFWQL